MELLKLLLDISLIFVALKTIRANSGKLSQNEISCLKDMHLLKLIGYDIILTPYINEDYKNTNIYERFQSFIDEQRAKDNFIFYGESTMSFKFRDKLNKICLHALNLDIESAAIKIVFSPDGVKNVSQVPKIHTYDEETHIIKLYYDDLHLSDSYTYHLIMKFVGSITHNTGGFIKTSYINNKGEKQWLIVAADFRGIGARQIFPCWDEPDIKTKFTISIKHYVNYTALSNSPVDEYIDDNDMVWTRFRITNDISPYRVAILLFDLHSIVRIPVLLHSNTNMWCREDVKQQIKFALEMTEDITLKLKLSFYNTMFPKTNEVVIPGFRDEGLESWGLVLYREAAIIYDEKLDFIAWKFEVARTIARKMVHQFFGNLVSQSWWSNMWLNEGIASFMAMRIVKEYVHPHLMDLFIVQYRQESLRLNDYYDMPLESEIITPSDINSLFSFTYYVKAPVIVRALLQKISTRTLIFAFNIYLAEYQHRSILFDISNSTTDKFFDVLQEVLRVSNESSINFTRLAYWAKHKRYPVLQVTRHSENIEIKLLRKYLDEIYPKHLWISVTYTTQSASNITKEKWIHQYNQILNLTDVKENDWIIVNVQQAEYYRVNYDKQNWQKLMEYLNSVEYFNIHVLNRAQIIDDAYYFLLNNKLNFRFFKNLTYYLSRETNYVAWYPMFKIMEAISGFFPFLESTEVKEHFRKILELVLTEIGYRDRVKEDVFIKCLRQEAAKWACTLNSSQCTTAAVFELMWLYKVPESMLPWRKEWIHCKGMMVADNATWNDVWYAGVLNNKLLKFLACSENHTFIINYIDRLKSAHFIEARYRIATFHSIITRHAKNDVVLNYIIKNFTNVIPSEIKMIVALTDIINHVYTKDQLNKIDNYAKSNFSNKIFLYIIQKIARRVLEINKHVAYFKIFLK